MMADRIENASRRVLVLGLGKTGLSVVRHLHSKGMEVTVADSRDLPPNFAEVRNKFSAVEVITGRIPYERFGEFDQVITSPGISGDVPGNLPAEFVIGDIELFAGQVRKPVIAITGSNGKSTVTMLVTEMLSAAGCTVLTGGNIGTPALDLLEQEEPDFYVLELSSFQLEDTYSLKPVSATVLNISEDHMDRYRSLSEYADTKSRIFSHAHAAVINRQDPAAAGLASGRECWSFGLDAPHSGRDFGVVTKHGKRYFACGDELLAECDRLVLPGDQNVANVLAAMALVQSAGINVGPEAIDTAMNYPGLPHRCEVVSAAEDVTWINDSKGTNVGATVAAINGFRSRLILIAGGQGKGADFSPLGEVIADRVAHTVLFGEDAESIRQSMDQSSDSTTVDTLQEAVNTAARLASPGTVVLFSPACASFDMFESFEHRGDVFRSLVLGMVR